MATAKPIIGKTRMNEKTELTPEFNVMAATLLDANFQHWFHLILFHVADRVHSYFKQLFKEEIEKDQAKQLSNAQYVDKFKDICNSFSNWPHKDLEKQLKKINDRIKNFENTLNMTLKLYLQTLSITRLGTKSKFKFNNVDEREFIFLVHVRTASKVGAQFPHLFNPNEDSYKVSQNNFDALKKIVEITRIAMLDCLPLAEITKKSKHDKKLTKKHSDELGVDKEIKKENQLMKKIKEDMLKKQEYQLAQYLESLTFPAQQQAPQSIPVLQPSTLPPSIIPKTSTPSVLQPLDPLPLTKENLQLLQQNQNIKTTIAEPSPKKLAPVAPKPTPKKVVQPVAPPKVQEEPELGNPFVAQVNLKQSELPPPRKTITFQESTTTKPNPKTEEPITPLVPKSVAETLAPKKESEIEAHKHAEENAKKVLSLRKSNEETKKIIKKKSTQSSEGQSEYTETSGGEEDESEGSSEEDDPESVDSGDSESVIKDEKTKTDLVAK